MAEQPGPKIPLTFISERLTPSMWEAIDSLYWGMQQFGQLTKNLHIRKRTVEQLCELGIAQSAGKVISGGDKENPRYQNVYQLTEYGMWIRRVLDRRVD